MELVIPDVSNRESRIVLFTDEEKRKNPGSPIKDVGDDRRDSFSSLEVQAASLYEGFLHDERVASLVQPNENRGQRSIR